MRVSSRLFLGGFLAALVLATAVSAGAARSGPAAALTVPLPAPGNVTVARLTLAAGTTSGSAPRLALTTRAGLGANVVVAAASSRKPGSKLAVSTVAIVDSTDPGSRPARAKSVTLRLPPGYRLARPMQVAKDVLYQNAAPGFALVGGSSTMLAGANAPKLAPSAIVKDAQLLALERSVPLVDIGLLGLQFVAVQMGQPQGTLSVTFGLNDLPQVNAVELRFPKGIRVTKVSGPPDTDGLPVAGGVQLVASRGFFQEGVSYPFTLELSAAPKRGDFVNVRASVHYFESSLPFIERFVVGQE
jgi:hypothetical protein